VLAAGGVVAAMDRVRERFPDVTLQVEVTTVDMACKAVEAGAKFLLCDNMTPDLLGEVVLAVGGRAELEATGGLRIERAREYAETGVDYLSVGALTHSAPVLDLALDLRLA
jgi:nicotinate-nucleotide pyrophosphorylase (carboxylating)